MNLAILLPDLRGGGAERVSLDLGHQFRQLGWRVTFLLMRGHGQMFNEAAENFEVVVFGAERVRQAYSPLRRWIQIEQPQILIAAMWPLTVLATVAVRGTSTKVLISDHNPLSRQYQSWGFVQNLLLRKSISWAYPKAWARVGVSAGVAHDMEQLGGLNKGSVSVVHNPVRQPKMLSPAELAKADLPWLPCKSKRLLTVGSLKLQKNHALLLRSFAMLVATQDAQLVILGEGDLRESLEQLSRDLGIVDKVIFAGFQHNTTAFYQTADLFVLSSDYEGFGNVIVEALACGTPVVSTDCPSGPAEILDNGKYGALVPVGDELALAEAMQVALYTEHEPERLRARARDFAPEVSATRYLELLN